jgi:hypothetical protein
MHAFSLTLILKALSLTLARADLEMQNERKKWPG